MARSRRDVIKLTLSALAEARMLSTGTSAVILLTGCSGGGSSPGGGGTGPVTPAVIPPTNLKYSVPSQGTVGVSLGPFTPTVSGTVTSYSVAPAFPAGVTLNASTGVIAGTPTAAAALTTYVVTAKNSAGSTTFAVAITINGVIVIAASTSSPIALTPLSLMTTGLDTTMPYAITLSNSGGSIVPLTPIRTQANGTVVIAVPLVIDAASGQTSGFNGSLQISQNGLMSNVIQITITDLPSLSALGLQPGQLSRAFNTYQTIALGTNINMHQAIGLLPSSKGVPGSLLTNLNSQLLGVINARNILDNIVANQSYSLPVGTANDGTGITFDQNSVSILDRIIAQYLGAITNQDPVSLMRKRPAQRSRVAGHFLVKPDLWSPSRSILSKGPTTLLESSRVDHPEDISGFVQTLGAFGSAANIVATGQSLSSKNSTTLDQILSVASTGASIITVGATIVAATAAAPELAAGAIAVGAWSALAGVTIGSAMVGNDIYNLGTSLFALSNTQSNSPTYAATYASVKSAGANLLADGASTYLNTIGVGGFETVIQGTVLQGELSILGQVIAPEATDVALGFTGLLTTTANIYAQHVFEEDIDNATTNLAQAPAPGSASGIGFGIIDGSVDISNANGAILSPLTGVAAGTSSNDELLTTMADSTGSYSLVVPLGSPNLTYPDTSLLAYDPISGEVLSTTTVDLTPVTAPNQSFDAPTLNGSCVDTDAGNPDGDDPDCD